MVQRTAMPSKKKGFNLTYQIHKLSPTVLFLLITMVIFPQSKVRDSLVRLHSLVEAKKVKYDSLEYLSVLNEIGFQYRFIDNDSLLYFAEKARILSAKIKDDFGLMNALTLYGNHYADKGENMLAMDYYQKAHRLAMSLNNEEFVINLISELANQYDYNGQPGESLKMYKKGIALAKKVKFNDMLSVMHTNLGILYNESNFHEEAVREFLIADSINRKEKDTFAISLNLMDLSYGVLKLGRIDEAWKYGDQAITLLEKMDYPEWLAYAYLSQGEIAIELGLFEKAIHLLIKAKNLIDRMDDFRASMELQLALGKCKAAFGQIDSAEYYLNNGLIKAKKLEDNQSIEKALQELYELQISKNDTEKALDLVLQYTAAKKINDSVRNMNNLILIGAEIDFKKSQNKNRLLAQKKIERQNLITYSVILLISALTVIILLIRRNTLNQKRSNEKLEELNISKDKVFSIIGKDLKKPIHTLQEVLSLYDNKNLEEGEIANMTATLKVNLDYSSFTLNNLLYWAKTQMKGLAPSPKPTNVKTTIREVLETFDDEIQQKNLSVELDAPDSIFFNIDPVHLSLILSNGISNAIKYSNLGGQINIKVSPEDTMAKITICDKGIGMNEEIVHNLINKGHIDPQLGTLKEKGTGIGLVLSVELMELYGGQIQFKSKQGQGTCVDFVLPQS